MNTQQRIGEMWKKIRDLYEKKKKQTRNTGIGMAKRDTGDNMTETGICLSLYTTNERNDVALSRARNFILLQSSFSPVLNVKRFYPRRPVCVHFRPHCI